MGRNRSGIRTQARIIDAIRALLAEVGLDGTTIQAICDRAGIRPGSFYNLFTSKEEAIMTVVGEAITAVDPDPSRAGHDTVAELTNAFVQFMTGEPVLARIYLQLAVGGGLADPSLAHRVLSHHRTRVGRFTDALQREHPVLTEAEAERRAEVLLATLNGMALHYVLDPGFDFADHAALLEDPAGFPG